MKLYEQIIQFYSNLENELFNLPLGYKSINPFIGEHKNQVKKVSSLFYQKYYSARQVRRIILGSSPARRGSAVTGVPFEDAIHLQNETGIYIDNFYINKSSSDFLYEVMERYGGCGKFYNDFYMSFVCPLGIVKINSDGKEVNCNYYENKKLQDSLEQFIVNSIKKQIELNIDTSICYCIGSGENYKFLLELNKKHNFFQQIIPLEHPRFIMQYNKHRKEEFIDKYLSALRR
ncbi:MAG: SMUG2 DNA glycosylase family protein [Bacilli bacterium]|nr:SMUG2 DNA glycosylase family protein [Bacilli bacterium]